MQDIDFDEIDRAVSSVTSSNSNGPVNAAPANVATPVVPDVTVPTETATPVVPPSVASPAARRSTGRFMDVVHASSDMRPTRSVAARPEPTAAASSAFHWPDPIESLRPSTPPAPAPEVVVEKPVAFVPEPIVAPVVEPPVAAELVIPEEVATPLESPFLTNAKVEKRPLGAFSDESGMALIEDPIPFSGNDEVQPVTLTETSPEVEALLAETETLIAEPEVKEETPLLEAHVESSAVAEVPSWVAPAPVLDVENIPVGPTSITQQYKEQPSDADQASGSIFDTESYHQALVHAPQKRSSILIIVWIIALILVGGGIGAGVYFVVLPLLG